MNNCCKCKNYCGFFRADIDYVKCNYWDIEIEFRAAVDTKAIVCPMESEYNYNKYENDIIIKAIEFCFSLKEGDLKI